MRRALAVVALVGCALPNLPPPGVMGSPTRALAQADGLEGNLELVPPSLLVLVEDDGVTAAGGFPILAGLGLTIAADTTPNSRFDVQATLTPAWTGISPGIWVHTGGPREQFHLGGRVGFIAGTGDVWGVTNHGAGYVGVDLRLQGIWGLRTGDSVAITLGGSTTVHIVGGDRDVGFTYWPGLAARYDWRLSDDVSVNASLGVGVYPEDSSVLFSDARVGVAF